MAESSGRLVGDMKWLLARYPKAPGKLIKLGSILTKAEEPESSINRNTEIPTIPDRDKYDESIAVRQHISTTFTSNLSALLKADAPANPLASAGAKIQASSNKDVKTTVDAMNVCAEVFIPTEGYMDEALATPEVIKAVAKDLKFTKSLYIIVGVATAGSLKEKEEISEESKASMSMNVSLAGSGGGGAAELEGGKKANRDMERDIDQECDFAYRVREFEYSRMRRKNNKWVDKGDRTKGTMFGADRDDGYEVQKPEDYIPKFDSLAEDDEIPSTLFSF